LIIKEAEKYEQERETLSQQTELCNGVKKQYEAYSKYAKDDPGLINILYNKLEDALKEKERLCKKQETLMQEIGEIERSLEEYKAFRSFEEDVDGRVQNLSGSIKELEQKKRM